MTDLREEIEAERFAKEEYLKQRMLHKDSEERLVEASSNLQKKRTSQMLKELKDTWSYTEEDQSQRCKGARAERPQEWEESEGTHARQMQQMQQMQEAAQAKQADDAIQAMQAHDAIQAIQSNEAIQAKQAEEADGKKRNMRNSRREGSGKSASEQTKVIKLNGRVIIKPVQKTVDLATKALPKIGQDLGSGLYWFWLCAMLKPSSRCRHSYSVKSTRRGAIQLEICMLAPLVPSTQPPSSHLTVKPQWLRWAWRVKRVVSTL